MRAGRLRHKVTLFAPTSSVTALGEIETAHTSLGTYYAEVISKTGTETKDQDTLVSATAYTVHLRYNSSDLTDIPPAAYLVFEGRNLKVLSIAQADHRKRILTITAEESR